VLLALSPYNADTRVWFKPFGAPVSAPQVLATSTRLYLFAALVPRGDALVAWGDAGNVVALDAPPGGQFGAPTTLAGATPSGLAVDSQGHGVLAIEAAGSRGLGVVGFDPLAGFGTPQIVSTVGRESSNAGIAVDAAGDAILGWQDPTGNLVFNTDTVIALRAAGGPFAPAFNLNPTPGQGLEVFGPLVSISDQGVASAVWTQVTGLQTELLAQSYTAGAPTAPPSLIAAGPIAADSLIETIVPPRTTQLGFPQRAAPDRHGRLTATLFCGDPPRPVPDASTGTCNGRITIALQARRRLRLATTDFRIPINQTVPIAIQLTRSARRLLGHHVRLHARVLIATRYASGSPTTTRTTATITR
jgi:hypothetical protein